MNFIISARCENGHVQEILLDGSFGLEWANQQAGLLDGSSRFYLHDPRKDPNSSLGKCGICRTQIKCTVDGPELGNAGESWPEKPKATLSGDPPAPGMENAGAPQPIDPVGSWIVGRHD